jgi:Mg-chelatase subunit ChlD
MAVGYYSETFNVLGAITNNQKEKVMLKCKTHFRKLLSGLNKKLDTTQIKQCAKTWSLIDFNKVTSITLSKQSKAFLNKKKDGSDRFPEDDDRIQCAENLKTRIEKAVKGEVQMKGARVEMADFTKRALKTDRLNADDVDEINLLNLQWQNSSSLTRNLGKMIAMVDTSGSMDGEPMNVAIALGIRIAEHSVLGKRVMTFSCSPTWVNLTDQSNFTSMVKTVHAAPWAMSTNFHKALDLILDAIVQQKLSHKAVEDMVLVILSDMQMDQGDQCNKDDLYTAMKKKYETAGIQVHGTPYNPPHILFWNLRATNGFPTLSNQPNCSMMSGFSPALLNTFCEKGLDGLQSATPWSMLLHTLDNPRYKRMNFVAFPILQKNNENENDSDSNSDGDENGDGR